mmetsp:Transcript_18261/g.23682  ORF Transcript_18261/g.23682 Transcript_18261/m.23682 type:complete len:158 (+) Transcript_18261:134-607(+)|eukprot:CAMPEP_0116054914 /NCGR_PEP_ID=MMETSP0322-20121206/3094_1 /TAXON_ID=163516 /ORGANISM="Leptocylindrus danicus var. apora, Strain B651" /LENGTH=157 /DNA_ID=CAMNT_0003538415 /DNA_START=75 /DNA_END=548 /DNA_ORIENTATION=+
MNRFIRNPTAKYLCQRWTISTPKAQTQNFHASPNPLRGLEEFREPKDVRENERTTHNVGRSWTVKELRRKSFDDLHKLWLVLYKERNMILTEMHHARRNGLVFPQPERKQKVKKSMGAIKVVLGERKRDKLAQIALNKLNKFDNGNEEKDEDENLLA